MFRGYRGIICAFGGLILWSQAPRAHGVPSPSPAPKEQPSQTAQASNRKPKPLAVTIVESPEQAEAGKRREAQSDSHEASDLDAQIRAADAAEKQVFPAWLAAILGFAGTGLIVWTLCLTRKANTIAQDTAKQQLAAYVAIESATIIIKGHSIKAVAKVRNFGETPAYNVSVGLSLHLIACGGIRGNPVNEEVKGAICQNVIGVLPPNCSIPTDFIGWNNAIIGLPDLPDYLDDPLAIRFIIVTNGQLSWDTVFGEPSALGVSIIYEDYQFMDGDISTQVATGIVRHNAPDPA